MVEYVTLAQAKSQGKGNVVIKVLKEHDIKVGDTWKRQALDVVDESGAEKLTLWNDDIGKLKVGETYGLEQPFWKEYEGSYQLQLGKFCTIHTDVQDVQVEEGQTTIDAPKPKGVDFKKLNESNVTDSDKIEFARKALTAFITEVQGNDVDPNSVREQFGAVWNTALMNKK